MGPSSLAAVGLLVAMSVGMSAEGRESNTSLQHTFISVSGWPQSGTSLLQQLFTVLPSASTMVHRCFETHGGKCKNINNEGQWLFNSSEFKSFSISSSMLDSLYGPGRMCCADINRSPSTHSKNTAAFISNQWQKYWDFSKQLLVQKSPQDMLKIPLIQYAMKPVIATQRFIIIIKHPASLNIALPRKTEWLYRKDRSSRIVLNAGEINENFNYFYNTMTKSSKIRPMSNSTSSRCNHRFSKDKLDNVDLGWLPAMEALYSYLKENSSIRDLVKIVRFEDLALNPFRFCSSLVSFSMTGYSENLIAENIYAVCNRYFKTNEVTAEIKNQRSFNSLDKTILRKSKLDRFQKSKKSVRQISHRNLRLRPLSKKNDENNTVPEMYQTVDFSQKLASESIASRLLMFLKVTGTIKTLSSITFGGLLNEINKAKLLELEKRISPFGYKLICPYKKDYVVEKLDNILANSQFHIDFVLCFFPYKENAATAKAQNTLLF